MTSNEAHMAKVTTIEVVTIDSTVTVIEKRLLH